MLDYHGHEIMGKLSDLLTTQNKFSEDPINAGNNKGDKKDEDPINQTMEKTQY